MDWRLIVPGATELREVDLSEAREVRLRPGQPIWALMPDRIWQGTHSLAPEEVFQAAQALSGHALAARQRELRSGFLPLPGGHRLGVCGIMDDSGLREITSLCVRQCHQLIGAGEKVFPLILGKNALILGPPGAGKTTLLRDLVRLHGMAGIQTGLIDERGEIAACRDGKPLLDVGPLCDVVTGMEKAAAARLLIRSMAPGLIATDELGGPEDGGALNEAVRCGVRVLATAHARSTEDFIQRQGMAAVLPLFDTAVILNAPGCPPEIKELKTTCVPCSPFSP
jgi:stage III sporulation protein AA